MADSKPAVIVALPPVDHPINAASSEDEAHCTLVYLGDSLTPQQVAQITEEMSGVAASSGFVTESVTGRGTLGDDEADVVHLGGAGVAPLRDALLAQPGIRDAFESVKQFPTFRPHTTLGYPESPAQGDPPDSVDFDRLALWNSGDHSTQMALEGDMANDEPSAAGHDQEAVDEQMDPIPWHSLMVLEGVPTGDRRAFAPDSLRFEGLLPLPLFDEHGGNVIGQLQKTWKIDNQIWGSGVFNDTPEAAKAIQLIANGDFRGASIDADDYESELADRNLKPMSSDDAELSLGPDGDNFVVDLITTARIRGLSLAPIAAFAEAYISLGAAPEDVSPADPADQPAPDFELDEEFATLVREFLGEDLQLKRGAGWITAPAATKRIHDYWTVPGHAGYAKVRYLQPGDFYRLRKFLAKYIAEPYLTRTAAQWHHDATGLWPGQEGGRNRGRHDGQVLVASAAPRALPPAAWFTNPNLERITPITVRADEATGLMRVFGHVAEWGSCHVAWSDRVCVPPPSSPSSYAYYLTGETETDQGMVLTGRIVGGTEHADTSPHVSFAAATAHYDNTGNALADVVVGEDSFGIWMSGWVRPWISEQQLHELRASAVSGDWRPVQGQLEMIGVLSCNVNAFQIPRVQSGMRNGRQMSLVASGVVLPAGTAHGEAPELDRQIDLALERFEQRQVDREVAKLASVFQPTIGEQVARLAAVFEE